MYPTQIDLFLLIDYTQFADWLKNKGQDNVGENLDPCCHPLSRFIALKLVEQELDFSYVMTTANHLTAVCPDYQNNVTGDSYVTIELPSWALKFNVDLYSLGSVKDQPKSVLLTGLEAFSLLVTSKNPVHLNIQPSSGTTLGDMILAKSIENALTQERLMTWFRLARKKPVGKLRDCTSCVIAKYVESVIKEAVLASERPFRIEVDYDFVELYGVNSKIPCVSVSVPDWCRLLLTRIDLYPGKRDSQLSGNAVANLLKAIQKPRTSTAKA